MESPFKRYPKEQWDKAFGEKGRIPVSVTDRGEVSGPVLELFRQINEGRFERDLALEGIEALSKRLSEMPIEEQMVQRVLRDTLKHGTQLEQARAVLANVPEREALSPSVIQFCRSVMEYEMNSEEGAAIALEASQRFFSSRDTVFAPELHRLWSNQHFTLFGNDIGLVACLLLWEDAKLITASQARVVVEDSESTPVMRVLIRMAIAIVDPDSPRVAEELPRITRLFKECAERGLPDWLGWLEVGELCHAWRPSIEMREPLLAYMAAIEKAAHDKGRQDIVCLAALRAARYRYPVEKRFAWTALALFAINHASDAVWRALNLAAGQLYVSCGLDGFITPTDGLFLEGRDRDEMLLLAVKAFTKQGKMAEARKWVREIQSPDLLIKALRALQVKKDEEE